MPDVTVYSGNSFPQATTLGRSPGENSAEKGLKSDSPEPDPVRTPGPLHPSGLPQGLTDRRGQRHGSFAFSETDQGGGTGTAPAVVVVGPEPSPLRAPRRWRVGPRVLGCLRSHGTSCSGNSSVENPLSRDAFRVGPLLTCTPVSKRKRHSSPLSAALVLPSAGNFCRLLPQLVSPNLKFSIRIKKK